MKNKGKTLKVAIGKLKLYTSYRHDRRGALRQHREFIGELTPAEIVALHKDGWQLSEYCQYKLEYALKEIKTGIGGRTFVSFQRTGEHKPEQE